MGGRSGKIRLQPGFTKITGPRNTDHNYVHRLLIGIPTLGMVRMEWANAFSGVIIPTNFSSSKTTPLNFRTDDAQNVIAQQAIDNDFEWLFLLEDDVAPPIDLFIKLREYMEHKKYPIVSGVYNLKGNRPEPMIYRGRGNGPFRNYKDGDKVWADGVPTGCLLVHVSLLEALREHSEIYTLQIGGQGVSLHRIFEAPRTAFEDVETGAYRSMIGTSDLFFCDRIRQHHIMRQCGWPKMDRRAHPFLVDTSIKCKHLDRNTGFAY